MKTMKNATKNKFNLFHRFILKNKLRKIAIKNERKGLRTPLAITAIGLGTNKI